MQKEFLSKILDTLEDKADVIGGIYGLMSDPLASTSGLGEIPGWAMDRIKIWKIPNPVAVIETMFQYPEAYPLGNAVVGAIGGWALNEVGGVVDSRIAKLGRAVKKMSISSIIGMVIGGHIWLAAHPTPNSSISSSKGVYS